MGEEVSNFRDILRRAFRERQDRNASYSLRAFARDLKLGPEWLSRIFAGKQGMSKTRAIEIAKLLNFSPDESALFHDLVESKHGRSRESRIAAQARLQHRQSIRSVPLDTFLLIKDWYHMAILQLSFVPSFQFDAAWIAAKLTISESEARQALERLVRLDLLKQNNEGRWTAPNEFIAGPDGVPSEALKAFHLRILERAMSALQRTDLSERDISTVILPFKSANMSEARKIIRQFRRSFEKQLPTDGAPDSVYSLGIQFVRLDQKNSKEP